MNILRILAIAGAALWQATALCAADDSAIIDGPNYAFTIRAPAGWHLTSTRQIQAGFYPNGSTFEASPTIMYARSGDKKQLHVRTIEEMNRLDLRGIQESHPDAKSEKVGIVKIANGSEIPVYTFSGGGYFERVAYAEETNTITVFVVSAETKAGLEEAGKAFQQLVESYQFITNVKSPK
jgi:hypothetical protein